MYYIKCLVQCDDVREQNRQAFELYKLGEGADQQFEYDLEEQEGHEMEQADESDDDLDCLNL